MIKKLLKYINDSDYLGLLYAIRRKIPRKILYFNRAYLYEIDREAWLESKQTFSYPMGYSSRFAGPNDFPEIVAISGLTQTTCNDRLKYGDRCFCIFENNQPVNMNWIHRGSCYVRGFGYYVDSTMDESYIYSIITKPTSRGKGLYKNSLIELTSLIFSEGCHKIIQMAEFDNLPVLKTLALLNYQKTTVIKHRSFLIFKYTSSKNIITKKTKRTLFVKHRIDSLTI